MPELKQVLEQRQKLTPQQILQMVLLQVNTIDLEERIAQELAENPLLEVKEAVLERDEDAPADDEQESDDDGVDWEDMMNSPDDFRMGSRYDRSREHRELPLADRPDPIEQLLEQIRMMDLTDDERVVAEEIGWNIDERGYLATDVEMIGGKLGVSPALVEEILKKVQRLDPVGIGARNLRECLQVQLEEAGNHGLALEIVSGHFDDFANRRFEKLQRATGCTEEELNQAVEVISRLNPKPGLGAPTSGAEFILPDLIVENVDGELVTTVNDSRIPELQMSPVYMNLLEAEESSDPEVKKFLRRKLESARWFIQAVEQRQITMLKVMKAIMDHQKSFFSGDTSTLKPMILKDIAEKIDMDVSTVSRVTRGKYVQTPYGIFELKYFFSEGLATKNGEEVSTKIVKEVLSKVIKKEDKRSPHSDDELADILKKKGYLIARRTVAKYREQLKIPVARLRREL